MHARWLLAGLLYAVFLAYASFVPLAFRPISLAQAWERFQHIPFLTLGLYSRADWIANGVLFVPLAFFWCAALGGRSAWARLLTGLGVFFFCSLEALLIEFGQLYFLVRTVSQNDMYAEIVGSAVGVCIWLGFGKTIVKLLHDLSQDLQTVWRSAAVLYSLLYVAIALFPYDFAISWSEIAQLIQHRPLSTLLFGTSCPATLRCLMNLGIEIAAIAPLGTLLTLPGKAVTPRWWCIFLLGVSIGLGLEGLQFFMYSGNVAAISLLTRGLGLVTGYLLVGQLHHSLQSDLATTARRMAPWLFLPYLLVLMVGNHWSLRFPAPLSSVLRKVQQLNFMPFYYHYYAPETTALQKLLYHTAMYIPLGLLYWSFTAHRPGSRRCWLAGLLGTVVALGMGVGRLFLDDALPDPTNLWIAFVVAVLGYSSAQHVASRSAQAPVRQLAQERAIPSRRRAFPVLLCQRTVAVALGSVLVFFVSRYPWYPVYLGLSLVIYGLLLLRYPRLWIVLFPVALPLLDFGTRTGWLIVDEVDLFMLLTIAIHLWRARLRLPEKAILGAGKYWISIVILAFLGSSFISFSTMKAGVTSSLLGYDSPLYTLRIVKAILWPWSLLPFLLEQYVKTPTKIVRYFALGAGGGLLIASLGVWWERALFTGLFDFELPYRAAGNFSSMNIGGAALDAYLVMSLPFLGFAFLGMHKKWLFTTCGVFLLACYAILVTFTRTTYLATGGVLLFMLLGAWCTKQGIFSGNKRPLLALVVCTLLVLLGGSVPGTFMYQRWRGTFDDVKERLAHWSDILRLRADGTLPLLFGTGLGSFPSINLAAQPEHLRPGRARLISDPSNTFLRLQGGTPTFIDQRIAAVFQEPYWLLLEARTTGPSGRFHILICEKNVLNSTNCLEKVLNFEVAAGWQRQTVPLQLTGEPHAYGPLRAPIYLSLSTPPPGQTIDVDDVHLVDRFGTDLLHNGDFATGRSRWYFTNDDHLVWNVKNTWVYLLFETGLCGVLGFTMLILYLACRVGIAMQQRQASALMLGASLLGFFILSCTDSILTATQPTMFFGLLCMLIVVSTSPALRQDGART